MLIILGSPLLALSVGLTLLFFLLALLLTGAASFGAEAELEVKSETWLGVAVAWSIFAALLCAPKVKVAQKNPSSTEQIAPRVPQVNHSVTASIDSVHRALDAERRLLESERRADAAELRALQAERRALDAERCNLNTPVGSARRAS